MIDDLVFSGIVIIFCIGLVDVIYHTGKFIYKTVKFFIVLKTGKLTEEQERRLQYADSIASAANRQYYEVKDEIKQEVLSSRRRQKSEKTDNC